MVHTGYVLYRALQCSYGDAINEEQDFGEKARVSAVGAECQYKECQWENSGVKCATIFPLCAWWRSVRSWRRSVEWVLLTEKILEGELMWDRRMKDEIRRVDHEESLRRCAEKAPLIAEVEKRVSWVKLWDTVLNFGLQHTRGLQTLSRLMSHHERGNQPCLLCDRAPMDVSVMEHVLAEHWTELRLEPEADTEWLLNRFVDMDFAFFVLYMYALVLFSYQFADNRDHGEYYRESCVVLCVN